VPHLRSHPTAMPRAHTAIDPMVSTGFCRGRTDAYGLGEHELEGSLSQRRAHPEAPARTRDVHASQGPPEAKIELVREFLRREFRECQHRDFFELDEIAQVFIIETPRRYWHILVIPKATFEHPDFARLCNAQLAATLALVRESRVTLTPQGPLVRSRLASLGSRRVGTGGSRRCQQ
jgi:hypothetical protein